jgi:hypothetical protein
LRHWAFFPEIPGQNMRNSGTIAIVTATLVLLAAPVLAAGGRPGDGGLIVQPTPEQQMQRRMTAPAQPAPYPMNYTWEVAQSLGVRNGGLDLIAPQAKNPYAPSLSMGSGGMLRLRWGR